MTHPRKLHAARRRRVAATFLACGILSAAASGQRYDGSFTGLQSGEYQGWSVASGFDMNGNGVDDFIIGSPYYDRGMTNQGEVVIYDGKTHVFITVGLGSSTGELFGYSVALVNDLDGDGTGEYCVGAPMWNGGDGYVAMYSGKTDNLLWIIYGGTGAELGFSLAAAGDVDHDGKVDVVVGAPGIDTAYVFGWGTGAIYTLTGQSGSSFGQRVAGNVDVNGDGTKDFIVSQPYYSTIIPNKPSRGRVNVYSGATGATLFIAFGDDANDRLGESICGIGDVDGDGKAEVAAGAPFDDDNGTSSGLVRVFNSSGTIRYDLHGAAANAQFGYAVCGLPDMTRDGRADLAIGSPDAANPGVVQLVRGSDGTLLYTIDAPDSSYKAFGFSLATGDFNVDGSSDLLIGDPTRDVGTHSSTGDVDVYLAAPAWWQIYDHGWPGTSGHAPTFTAANDPGIGQGLTLNLGNSRGADTAALLFVGIQQISQPTSAGGKLLVNPLLVLTLFVPATGLDLSGSLPDDVALLLQEVDLQALEIDPGAPAGLSFTAGLELSLGIDYP